MAVVPRQDLAHTHAANAHQNASPHYLASIAAGAVFLFAQGATQSAAAEECELKRVASLDITDGPGGLVLVPLGINGARHLFLLDTGGIYSSINQSLVTELHLKTARIAAPVYDAKGHKLDKGAVVESLTIGSNEAKYIHMLVEPDSADSQIAGTLAPDVLSLFDVDMDFAHKKLNLFSPDHCEGKVVYWSREYTDTAFTSPDHYHIELQMSLDGHELTTDLDTGASVTAMREPTAVQLYHVSADAPNAEKTETAFALYRYRFEQLSLNGVAVRHPLVYVIPDATSEAFKRDHTSKGESDPIYGRSLNLPSLILGMDVLRQLHLYIAYKEHKIYATAADAHL